MNVRESPFVFIAGDLLLTVLFVADDTGGKGQLVREERQSWDVLIGFPVGSASFLQTVTGAAGEIRAGRLKQL